MLQLSGLYLSDNKNYINHNKSHIELISGLSRINILVGANNSGKSRFMRYICQKNKLNFNIANEDYCILFKKIEYILQQFIPIFDAIKSNIATGRIGEINITKNTNLIDFLKNEFTENVKQEISKIISMIKALPNIEVNSYHGHSMNQKVIFDKWQNLIQNDGLLKEYIEYVESCNLSYEIPKKVYIPILRTLNFLNDHIHDLDGENKIDILESRVKKIYGFGEDTIIFTGQKLYEEIRNMLLGDKKQRAKIKQFENFLKKNIFDNNEITLIPNIQSDVLYVSIGGNEKPIYDLGDGIQSIIIITYQMFVLSDQGAWFFIEEPEQNLHPSMQRKLIEVMMMFQGHQYRITTHSNHLLDMTLDYDNLSVYKFKGREYSYQNEENNKFVIEQVEGPNESVLHSLGVLNSSVFLANCTVWVEGITDRLYIKQYMKMYEKYLNKGSFIKEDIDYIYVEYGGNSITHWSFLDSYAEYPTVKVENLCSKLMLIADNDNDKAPARKDALRRHLEERFYELPCQEIENTLPLSVIKSIVKEYEGDSVVFSKTRRDITKYKLGIYIEQFLLSNNVQRCGGYKENSGTIKDKTNFCIKAIKYLENESFETLPQITQELVKKIYSFIIENKTN